MAISATTFIVYILANKVFGVSLRLKSLMLCAACALFISIVLPRIVVSFAGLAGTIGFLAVFALIFAYFVAYYDDSNKLQPAASSSTTLSVMEQPEIVQSEKDIVYSKIVPSPMADNPVEGIPPTLFTTSVQESSELETHTETLNEHTDQTSLGSGDSEQSADSIAVPSEIEAAALLEDGGEEADFATSVQESFELETHTETLNENTDQAILGSGDEQSVEIEAAATLEVSNEEEEETFTAASDMEITVDEVITEHAVDEIEVVSEVADDHTDGDLEIDYTVQDTALETSLMATVTVDENAVMAATEVHNTVKDVPECIANDNLDENIAELLDASVSSEDEEVMMMSSVPELQPPSDSLDDLLDFAFMLKEKEKFTQALDTFRKAFKLYRDNEAGPLIAIEIASLLKNRGAYDEAITVLTDGRSLDAVQRNDTLDQEFIQTIAFLRIVKNTLLQNRMGFAPYNEIPESVSEEIDAEFREWRNLA
jgi:tetratricopeptide (TPR) repeat protein